MRKRKDNNKCSAKSRNHLLIILPIKTIKISYILLLLLSSLSIFIFLKVP